MIGTSTNATQPPLLIRAAALAVLTFLAVLLMSRAAGLPPTEDSPRWIDGWVLPASDTN